MPATPLLDALTRDRAPRERLQPRSGRVKRSKSIDVKAGLGAKPAAQLTWLISVTGDLDEVARPHFFEELRLRRPAGWANRRWKFLNRKLSACAASQWVRHRDG
jgi:hypothetical protein